MLVLKEGGKFKKNEKWSTEEQQLEFVSEIRSEDEKHRWLETTENKEQSSWNLILTSLIQMPNQKVIYLGTHFTENLRDM
jgi:hypothetical protein